MEPGENKQSRTQDMIAAPGTIDAICAAVAATSTLAAWCREHDVMFSLVAAWIELDKDRRERYAKALAVREQHLKDDIVQQLRAMVTADLTTAFNANGTFKPLNEIPEGVRHWIAGIEIEELFEGKGEDRQMAGYTKKLKFFDKVRSTELLMKNLKMLVDRTETDVRMSLADLIAAAEEKKP